MRRPRLPQVTHLQFLVLAVLQSGERPGRTVRKAIGHYGVRRTAAAFYQMMARLERDGLVEGWYDQITIGDQAVTERRYRVTPAGARAWEDTRAFYENAGLAVARERWSDA
jgi:DNA-binding PadR family transcriptional regulator